MDVWEPFERAAVAVLERDVAKRPLDRNALAQGLHLFAMAKNRDPHVPMPPLDVLTDEQLVEMVEALLRGNQIGG